MIYCKWMTQTLKHLWVNVEKSLGIPEGRTVRSCVLILLYKGYWHAAWLKVVTI